MSLSPNLMLLMCHVTNCVVKSLTIMTTNEIWNTNFVRYFFLPFSDKINNHPLPIYGKQGLTSQCIYTKFLWELLYSWYNSTTFIYSCLQFFNTHWRESACFKCPLVHGIPFVDGFISEAISGTLKTVNESICGYSVGESELIWGE